MPVIAAPREGRAGSRRALAALALGAFAIGTAELMVVGVLNLIARDEHVSVSDAGQVVTAYALGIAVGAPVVTALTARLGRRLLLCLALGAFTAGNVLAATATDFGLLLAARVVTGSVHGLFIGVASVIAAGLVPPERRGQAISMVFGGIAVSTVVGVPLGTLIGQTAGWRAAFIVVIVLGAAALAASLAFVPPVPATGPASLRPQAGAALAPRVLAVLGIGLVIMGGQFTAFTYLTPFLQRVTGIPGGAVSGFLLVFGVAAAAGTVLGGKAADRNAGTTLLAASLAVTAALGFLYLVRTVPALVAVGLAAWGLATFAVIPSFQLRVITLAGRGADLAATLGASAINAGIAIGSLVGGAVIARHGASALFVVAIVVSAAAVPAVWAARLIRPPGQPPEPEPPSPPSALDQQNLQPQPDGGQ
ncbi:MAG TPA: MFS transporter [Streptosporangiaceae bacterium]|nr:MFS transporter [Streptosporangiaceae bacterium]